MHDVDENGKTIGIAYGGRYQGNAAGVTVKDLYYVSDTVSDRVAFEQK